MGYKNILVPLDGSALAELVLNQVAEVAEPGASIHILSVLAPDHSLLAAIALAGGCVDSPMVNESPSLNPYSPELIHEREDYLTQVAESLRHKGYLVTIDACFGEVVNSIVEVARDGYDAILMATHGRTGLAKAMLGSVAQSVVCKSSCPVVLISAHAHR